MAVDDLLYVTSYPPADKKQEVLRRERHCGGLTATALVAASRMGMRCAYAGVLGYDDLSCFAWEQLEREGIDLAHVVRRVEARPISSVIVVDELQKTRNIFFHLNGFQELDRLSLSEEFIRSAKVLFVDHLGGEAAVRAARIARVAGIPIVADLEDEKASAFVELLRLADHLILAYSFIRTYLGEVNPTMAVERLWTEHRSAVVITNGMQGCWYMGNGCQKPQYHPSFPVSVVDTTGCGDVFHGAYAAMLVHGASLPERVRIASAAAALKATQRGGQASIPSRAEVEAFLREVDT